VLTFINGQFVPEEQAAVSVFDRGFLYGDGLFETMLVANGKPFRWTQHLDRLQSGANFLSISLPYSAADLRGFADQLIARNKTPDALLRLTVSRGIGPRGYSPKDASQPTVVLSLHPNSSSPKNAPPRWDLITSSLRLPSNQPLAQFKTCNKLPQILARAEADAAGVEEALLLNTDGFVVEASSSNLFWTENKSICTPPVVSGILPGVTRAVVLEVCRSLKLEVRERTVTVEQLKNLPGVFLSLSSLGVIEAASLDGHTLKQSPLVAQIQQAYQDLVRKETR
jgi:branched-chain amino acid aminotransferase